jgi:hypothetical protein
VTTERKETESQTIQKPSIKPSPTADAAARAVVPVQNILPLSGSQAGSTSSAPPSSSIITPNSLEMMIVDGKMLHEGPWAFGSSSASDVGHSRS